MTQLQKLNGIIRSVQDDFARKGEGEIVSSIPIHIAQKIAITADDYSELCDEMAEALDNDSTGAKEVQQLTSKLKQLHMKSRLS